MLLDGTQSFYANAYQRSDQPLRRTGADRLKAGQPQHVQLCGLQYGHRSSAVTSIAVGVIIELCVLDPLPALNAPAVAHQLQQSFWGGAQAGEEQIGRPKRLAITDAIGGHLHDPAGACPSLTDVLWGLLGA